LWIQLEDPKFFMAYKKNKNEKKLNSGKNEEMSVVSP
jgi:hypothetical protein